MGALQASLSEIANLLRSRGFVDIIRMKVDGVERIVAQYGPMGTMLRHNILKQWWDKMICQQTNVFPIDNPFGHLYKCSTSQLGLKKNESDMGEIFNHDYINNYFHAIKLSNKRLPVSVASVGCHATVGECSSTGIPELRQLLLGSAIQTKLTLHNFTPPVGSSAILDYWLQLRLSWWKQFSRNPAKFSVKASSSSGSVDGKENDNTNGSVENSLSIMYDFPWGQESVENVKNLGDGPFKHIQDKEAYMAKYTGNKNVLPFCIECDTSLESAMAAWLIDGYHERPQVKGKKKTKSSISRVLQLHPKLSPFQVAIVMPSSLSSTPSSSSSPQVAAPSAFEMRHVCSYLEHDFKKSSVAVFNTCTHGGSVDAHYRRNDELGIPYTVVVKQNTVTDGLVTVRHRDTQVKTSYHISSLIELLTKNLQAQLD